MSNRSNSLRRVLVINNSTEGCDRYERTLQADPAMVYRISTEQGPFQSLSPESLQRFDGVLWVLDVPEPKDFEPVAALKSASPEMFPPLVVIGNNEAEAAVWALKQGVADYLVRDRITDDALRSAMRNVIENAELKQALQISYDRFQASVESLMDCFGIFTAIRDEAEQIVDFRIDYLNEAACTYHQMPREMQLGRRLCEVLPEHRASGLFDAYCQLVETGEPVVRDSVLYTDTDNGDRGVGRVFDIRATRLNDGFVASWRDITERQRIEQEMSLLVLDLQREQSRLKRLIDMAPIGIGIGTSEGEVKSLNDAMLRLHGYTREEFEQHGMNWRDFTPPEYAAQAAQAMATLPQRGYLPPEEKEFVRRDGTRIPVWISATQWIDAEDEHVAFAVDLTQQKQAEAELRTSQQRYRELAEAMPHMVWMADATGAITYWNQRWYEYTGLSLAESMGTEGVVVVHPDERDRTLELWEQAIANSESFEVEYRIRRRDGEYRWFICRGLPTQDSRGQVLGWIGTMTDIDEQKRLHERFQLAMHAVNGLVFDWDRQTDQIYRSENLHNLIGVHPDDAPPYLGWWNERIHPDDWERLQVQTQQFRTSAATLQETEYRIWHEEGHWVDVWDRSYLIRNDQGQVQRIVGSTVDISDRKRAERALETAHIQLKAALEAGSIYTWHWHLPDNRVVTSRRLAHLFGVDPDGAVSGLPIELFLAAVDPLERPNVVAAIDRAIATGEDYQAEFRLHDAEGQERWVIARGRVEYDTNGRAIALPGALADITERHQAEVALQKSQAQLQHQLAEIEAIYQSAPIGLSVLDRNLRFVRINERLAEINGLPSDAHLGRTLGEILPTLADAVEHLMRAALETGEPVLRIETQGETPAQPGVIRTWLQSFYPLKSDGQVVGINMVCEEITYRKQAEDALRQSEERYRTLFTSMNEGFCVIELIFDEQNTPIDYRFLENNPAFKQQTGFHYAEGFTVRELFPNLNEHCLEQYSEVARTGKSLRFEIYSHVIGQWFDVSAFSIGQPDSNKIAILFKDITHRKAIESNLRDRQERLDLATRAAGLGVFEWNLQTESVIWENQTMFDIFNRTKAEGPISYEEFFNSVIHPGDREWFEQCLQEALAPDKLFHAICRVRSPRSGSGNPWRWVEYSGRFERIPNCAPQRLVGVARDITDRIVAQEELRSRELQFHTLADNISQCAWMTDKDGCVFWYNQRWLDFTGTTFEEMQKDGWSRVCHPDHIDRVLEKFQQCIEAGETWEDTFPLRKHDDTYRWFLSRAIPIHDDQDHIFCWFGTNTDITVLRQTELALRQASERLNIALKTVPITLFNQNLDLRYTWVYNPAFDDGENDIVGCWDVDLFTPESAEHLTRLKRQVIETGVMTREEVKVCRLNGHCADYDLAIDPLRDENGTIRGITCAAVDISDRKRTAAALAANEARLRGFVESNVVGIVAGDVYGNIHQANDEFLKLLGYTREDFQNGSLRWLDMMPPEWSQMDAAAVAEARERGACTPYEKEYIRKDGSRVPVLVGYSLVGEDRVELVAFVLDLTHVKQAEAQLERLLQREQDARTEAEHANRVKDEFLAVLSHELRTPLNPILGWSKLLQTRKLDPEKTAQALAAIERNAKLQTQLIDDLLDVARILRGKLKLEPVPVNLAEVIVAGIDTVKHAAIAKSIQLRFSPDHAAPPIVVSGDAGRLQQVVWNLLSNAIKFTPNNGRVDIGLAQNANQAQITVTDTGKGISPDFLPYLFESFRQEDISITRQFGGLGLGLAIVRYLVEAHGGTIEASSPGEDLGATFVVSLPLLDEGPEEENLSTHPDQTVHLDGLQILVVDDDVDTCELLNVVLSQYGASVDVVCSVNDAIAKLEIRTFDLLISDISMPGTDGYALIQHVRQLPLVAAREIPAIALTACLREEDRDHALNSGFQEHMPKPLDIEQLLQAILVTIKAKPAAS
ncbi:PAS domain S-box protein [Vacuolonema iberomarrocanum]|uniref:PAS domain S-box protein n=1 Tax=Vacuolonema iberomarrocanum TaxID=3454632 RepID=UPI0019DB5E29|nr:PAS domain S-box protein [filamentous cyanobacterium LEGE 07170]